MAATSKHKFAIDVIPAARVAVIGCGWWAQGWHLPNLAANAPSVKIVAVVDPAPKLVSTLSSSPLLSLDMLSEKYQCPCYKSVSQMLEDIGPTLDGAIIATSHASHFEVAVSLLNEGIRRRRLAETDGRQGSDKTHRIVNILMEKPMTTDVNEAWRLWEMSTKGYPEGAFIINHTASYRPQTQIARHIIASNQIGKIRHISAYMNGPLMWLFNDPSNHSWVSTTPWKNATSSRKENEPSDRSPLTGNGYGQGQVAHLLAWIYTVLGAGEKSDAEEIAVPTKVYCSMSHAPKTRADISFAAVITCRDDVTFALSGTALLPGSQFSHPPIGKHVNIELFGEVGSLMYGGDDKIPGSGRLEMRRSEVGKTCQPEYPCSDQDWSGLLGAAASEMTDEFYFEDGDQEGIGPASLKAFLDACRNSCNGTKTPINDSFIGLRTVQIIDAMYRSSKSGNAEEIQVQWSQIAGTTM